MSTVANGTRITIKNILATTDFSPAAAAGLSYAGTLAKRFGAELFVVHVRAPVINPMTPPQGWPALERAAAEEDRERRESLRNAISGMEPTVLMEEGDVTTKLKDVIKSRDIDFIVMGTRGRTGTAKVLLGSDAEELIRDVECPVLAIGPHAAPEAVNGCKYAHILYATSFGTEHAGAAAYAISLAQESQAKLTLLHVLPDAQVGDFVRPQDLVESSKTRLAHLMPPEAEMWCEPEYVVERGEVAERILDVAKRRDADLIVLGVHKAQGVPGAATHLPISTAHKIVAQANCPVLTVPD